MNRPGIVAFQLVDGHARHTVARRSSQLYAKDVPATSFQEHRSCAVVGVPMRTSSRVRHLPCRAHRPPAKTHDVTEIPAEMPNVAWGRGRELVRREPAPRSHGIGGSQRLRSQAESKAENPSTLRRKSLLPDQGFWDRRPAPLSASPYRNKIRPELLRLTTRQIAFCSKRRPISLEVSGSSPRASTLRSAGHSLVRYASSTSAGMSVTP